MSGRIAPPPSNNDGDLPPSLFIFQKEKIISAHIGIVQRLTGLAAFFLKVVLPFFETGVIDGVGIAVNASLDVAVGAAGAAALFFVFFVLVAAEGTGGHGAQ